MNHQNIGSMLTASSEASVASILSSDCSHVRTLTVQSVTAALRGPARSGVAADADGYCFGRRSVEDAIATVARGERIVVVDDESRENEDDFSTPEAMAEFIRYSSGVISIGMEGTSMDEPELPAMVMNNEDRKGTAFSVSVDATSEHGESFRNIRFSLICDTAALSCLALTFSACPCPTGVTTEISTKDRAWTSVLLADAPHGQGTFTARPTSSPSARKRTVSWRAIATQRRRSTSRGWPARRRRGCCARS